MTAVAITLLELTEVAILVFAIGADHKSIRSAAYGAIAGTAVVAGVTLLIGRLLLDVPTTILLGASSIVLLGFGIFLFRSTLRSYRKARNPSSPKPTFSPTVQFAGGFSVGATETTEAAIVLIAIAAGGYPDSAFAGAIVGGVAVTVAAAVLHDRIRRFKVPPLKLGATAIILSFSLFWGVEAAGLSPPFGDLLLLPIFLVLFLALRGIIGLLVPAPPLETKG